MKAETSSTLFAATILFLIAIVIAGIAYLNVSSDEEPRPGEERASVQAEASSSQMREAGKIVGISRFYGTGQHWHVLTEYETKSGRAIWCINQGGELSCVTHR
jgi:hypothetical protein